MAMMNLVEALNLALDECLRERPEALIMGEDVGVDGGVFRVTKGLIEKYGAKRVVDTPLAEAGIIGTAIGMAAAGLRPVAEIQFSGFTYQAFHQIEQNMARLRNRTRGRLSVPMVMRAPYGGGIRAVEHHSESREAYWVHTPGLKVVIPSSPRAGRALLRTAILEDDPVIFYEPKAIYRAFKEDVPEAPETWPVGRARTLRDGDAITIVAWGAMTRPALDAAGELADVHDVHAEVLDLQWLKPMDTEALVASVRRTGRVVIVHEAPKTCGVGAEVAARIVEYALDHLEAPIRRVAGHDIVFPFFQVERFYLPDAARITRAVLETLQY
ncbi:MAG: alpha-ketoacid dehydrogenase subunit beta [Phycisphaerae bacterium]|nr:MAG: alpha-ketoacid dehydrogenase subunit beta [Planctomycetota bacterium]KAB2945186.1 MAG: alpha-ketoacid dehydrogenase subunit beta [Phycisphaerae bacterium]MBE7455926.1 alpha-ketoacid dehydrogenase subunit beta [Planctomycetia bacterium]MCK6464649.1 alpha-ketoacid dehydrogenase subunit beta [Phycisphaerae bacterium]MCL4717184.1 alpha-ketoacid dehydrogenase subunit beta [Phycisphaerae bacterium]